jgi:hypothetical protein
MAQLSRYVNDFYTRSDNYAHQLATGELNVNDWRVAMGNEIRTLHVGARVIGAGGWANLTPAHIAENERVIAPQLQYLQRWANQLDDMETISEAQVRARARMYARATTQTYWEADAMSKGVPRLPFYPADRTTCRTNCGCEWRFEFLEGNGNINAFWKRLKSDSCKVCKAREDVCSPLKIRGGKWELTLSSNLVAKSAMFNWSQ